MKYFYCFSLLILLGFLSGPVFAAGKEIAADKAEKITIDGKLDEAAWKNAKKHGGFTLLKDKGWAKPSVSTEFRFLCDEDAVYLGIVCNDPQMDKLKCDLTGEVLNLWENDLVELFFSPSGTFTDYYQFVVTAGGAVFQQYYEESGTTRPDPFMPKYEKAISRNADNWTLEIRLPFTAFYMTQGKDWKNKWLFNVGRLHKADNQNSTWSKLEKGFNDIPSFNTVSGIPARKTVQDLWVKNVFAENQRPEKSGYSATLTARVELNSAPEGKYTVEAFGKKIPVVLKKGSNTLQIPDVFFEKGGDSFVPVRVSNADHKVVHERRYPVRISEEALTVQFTRPCYNGHFYPGEKSDVLEGTVSVFLPEKEITISVNGKKQTFPVKNGKSVFSVDVSKISGDIRLQISVGKAQLTRTVRRIKDAKAWIRDGKIYVNGKPSFLLGWYGGTGFACSTMFRKRYPNVQAWNPHCNFDFIMMHPERFARPYVNEMSLNKKPSKEVFELCRKIIEANRNSPDYVYYLQDEPECRGKSAVYLKYLYDFIKEQDPTRLVMIISRNPLQFLDCADILCPHPYIGPMIDPVSGKRTLNKSVSWLHDVCADVNNAGRKDKALMLCPQAFSYTIINNDSDFPNFDETRSSVWSSICENGQGIYPYIWYDAFSRPAVDLAYHAIFDSLHRLGPLLSAEGNSKHLFDSREVASYRKDVGEDKLMILVNLMPEARSVTFENPVRMFRFRENGELKAGKVTLKFEPYQVIVLTSRKMDQGLKTVAEIRAEIDKAEYARSHRGNILFSQGRNIDLAFPESKSSACHNAYGQQDRMFDGILDVNGWMPGRINGPYWYELAFPKFTPEFSKARIYGVGLENMTFKIWKFGKWVTPEKTVKNGKYSAELDFGKKLKTVKIRLEFDAKNVELYEFELIQ